MPYNPITKSWVTYHGDLALLNVSRRDGIISCAFFEAIYGGAVSIYKWHYRNCQIECADTKKSLMTFFAEIHKLGTIRKENNEDYTSNNYRKRPDPGIDISELHKLRKVYTPTFFDRVKYRSRSDWVELPILTEAGRIEKIKINSYLVQYIPTKMIWREVKNGLYFLPNKQQKYYRSYNRHGGSLANYLLAKAGSDSMVFTRSDKHDYRISIDEHQRFLSALAPQNNFTHCDEGLLLEIVHPTGYSMNETAFSDAKYILPYLHHCKAGEERKLYCIFDKEYEDSVREYIWTFNDDDIFTNVKNHGHLHLKRHLARVSGHQIDKTVIPSRLNKNYQKAIDGVGDISHGANAEQNKILRRREKYENQIVGEMTTNNRMYTKQRLISHRNVHANKEITINGQVYLDLRIKSLRVGGAMNDDVGMDQMNLHGSKR